MQDLLRLQSIILFVFFPNKYVSPLACNSFLPFVPMHSWLLHIKYVTCFSLRLQLYFSLTENQTLILMKSFEYTLPLDFYYAECFTFQKTLNAQNIALLNSSASHGPRMGITIFYHKKSYFFYHKRN